MEVGLGLPLWSGDWGHVQRTALRAEQDGFDLVWVGDHLAYPPGAAPLESWTVLSAVAAQTTRIGLAAVTLSVPFRAPALVAKAATALQHVSGGRLRLLLGAGADAAEHEAFGLPYGTPRERVDRLEDALRVCRLLWDARGAPVDHEGPTVRLQGAVDRPPAPVPIPLGVGGEGPRVRGLAVELGEELCVGLLPDPAPVFDALAAQEAAAGRRLRRSVFAPFVADRASGSALVGHPRDLAAGPGAVRAQLDGYARAGVDTVYVVPIGAGAYTGVEDLLPVLRAG